MRLKHISSKCTLEFFKVDIKQRYGWMSGYVDIDFRPQSRGPESDGPPSLGYMGDKNFK